MSVWVPLLAACAGSYLIKLGGLSLPGSVLAHPRVQQVTGLLPVAMLAALVATGLLDGGRHAVDGAVLAGVAAGAVALLLRRGLLVVFLVAVAVTALVRLAVPA